jgi:methionyl-tRNA formyltransferase
MAGDQETGVAIMQMEKGLDTGAVYASQTLSIADSDSVFALERGLAEMGAELLIQVLGRLPEEPTPQADHGVCYAHKLTAEDRTIDWKNDAEHIARQIWALSHRMPAVTGLDGAQIQITKASKLPDTDDETPSTPGEQLDVGKKRIVVACGVGALEVHQLQITRGKGTPMDAAAARNGYADVFAPGRVFSAKSLA